MIDTLILCKACHFYCFGKSGKGVVWELSAETSCGICKATIYKLGRCFPVSKRETLAKIKEKNKGTAKNGSAKTHF